MLLDPTKGRGGGGGGRLRRENFSINAATPPSRAVRDEGESLVPPLRASLLARGGAMGVRVGAVECVSLSETVVILTRGI